MKPFLVRIATGGHRLSVHTIAASSIDALMNVLGSLEARGMHATSGSVRVIGRAA